MNALLKSAGVVLSLAAVVLFAERGFSQDSPSERRQPSEAERAKMAEAMEEWMRIAAPGEHHKRLEPFVGSWNFSMKMGAPGMMNVAATGTSEVRWVLGGRFLLEETKGTMMGMPYEGMGTIGYDNYRNLYVGTWTDTMGSHLLTMKGAADPAGKVFTLYGEMDEPSLKVAGRMVKYVHRIIDADKRVLDIVDLHAGPDYKVVEITYTRK